MLYLLVFVSGVVVGRKWDALKTVAAPLTGDAAKRFDTLYARTARSLAQTAEDLEDRWVELAYRDSHIMN